MSFIGVWLKMINRVVIVRFLDNGVTAEGNMGKMVITILSTIAHPTG